MDFNYSPEDEAFRVEVRSWLEANKKFAPPPSNIMADEGEGDWEARGRWHKKLNEGGWVAANWPKEKGGRGARPAARPAHSLASPPIRSGARRLSVGHNVR